MRLRTSLQNISRRFRVRLLLGLTIGNTLFTLFMVGLATLMVSLAPDPKPPFPPFWMQALSGVFTSVTLFMTSPLPWEWTGDDRPQAPFFRGLLQCILLIAAQSLLVTIPLGKQAHQMTPASLLMVVALAVGQYAFAGCVILAWEQRREKKAAAAHKAKEAQWTLLQSQMSPHALLNALNGLAQLVREDLEAGRQGVRDLSEIYRQLVTHGSSQRVPLSAERQLVNRFLAVEQLRLGRRLQVAWAWDDRLEALELPPLLLQPLVENAVKHGIAASEAGGELLISLRREGADLVLGVANTGRGLGDVPSAGRGIGLRNLTSRLGLAYGERAVLRLLAQSPWTLAEIRILGGAP